MRFLFNLLLLLLLSTLLTAAALLWFGLSDRAQVVREVHLSHQDIARAKALLKQNDPRLLPAGEKHHLRMTEADLNLAANYLLRRSQRLAPAGIEVRLLPGLAQFRASLHIPVVPVKPYVNLELIIGQAGNSLHIQRLRLGEVPVPPELAAWLLRRILPMLAQRPEYQLARKTIEQMQWDLRQEELAVTYRWDPALIDSVQSTLMTQLDTAALQAYHRQLLALQSRGIGRNGSLPELLQPLFELARLRSIEGDPVAENATLLSLLGAWALGQDLRRLYPELTPSPRRFLMKLQRRTDFAQHFLGSAALAVQGDTLLADALGLYKEVADTDHGSGFSFTDLAADRAGVRFGELATRSETEARRVQAALARGVAETDIMPPARDLPEFLDGSEFRAQFGEVGSERYNRVIEEIERRIEACGLYNM